MKKLMIATVLVMLVPSVGMSAQVDMDTCLAKTQLNKKAIRDATERKSEVVREAETNTGALRRTSKDSD